MNQLGAQLAASAGLVCLMALIHAMGVVAISHFFGLNERTLRAHRVDLSAMMLLVGVALSLFVLHIVEIGLFAGFYMFVGAIDEIEPALFFSASAYATLGQPEIAFPAHWRLVGAIEGLVGFLLIGWSTAIFFADMNKLLRDKELLT